VPPVRKHPQSHAVARARLVRVPPQVDGGTERVEAWVESHGVIGDMDLTLCHVCGIGVIEHVRVDLPHRRHGYGRRLIDTALAGSDLAWTTTSVTDEPAAQFWAAVAPDLRHTPRRCRHMPQAWDAQP